MDTEAPLELVAIIYRQDELAVILSRLENAGIWSFRHSAGHAAASAPMTLALGGIRLFVHRDEAQAARAYSPRAVLGSGSAGSTKTCFGWIGWWR